MAVNRRELHAAICADPDDIQLRVAYADFIQPYDTDRSEFVRIQLAQNAAQPMDDEIPSLGTLMDTFVVSARPDDFHYIDFGPLE